MTLVASATNRSPHSVKLILVLCWCNFFGCGYSHDCCYVINSWVKCQRSTLRKLPPSPAADKDETNRTWCGTHPQAAEITKIDLSNTNVSKIEKETLETYENIESFVINRCKFEVLEKNAFCIPGSVSHIESINLRHNLLKEVHEDAFAGLQNLTELDLSWNHLAKLPTGVFKGLSSLTELRLEGNQLVYLSAEIFQDLKSLRVLVLSSNLIAKVDRLPTSLSSSLRELDLRNNSITSIEENVFSKLETLGDIDLRGNKLTKLPARIFGNNAILYKIDLSDNGLQTLDENAFSHLCELRTLHLRSNKLKTASYLWFATVARNIDLEFEDLNDVIREDSSTEKNSWECKENDRTTAEYALFLMKICNDTAMKRIHLTNYLNIVCTTTNEYLVNPKDCSSDAIRIPDDETAILNRNKNGTCKNHPMCPFMSPACAGISEEFTNFLSLRHAGIPKTLIIFAMLGGFLTIVLVLVGYTYARQRLVKKRHFSESSTISEVSSSGVENDSIFDIPLDPSPTGPEEDDNLPSGNRNSSRENRQQPTLHHVSQSQPNCNFSNQTAAVAFHPGAHMAQVLMPWPQFWPTTDPFNLPPSGCRPRPVGSSDCDSTTRSVAACDSVEDDLESDVLSNAMETQVKGIASVSNDQTLAANDNEATHDFSMIASETHVKELFEVSHSENTEPKEVRQLGETSPKNIHLQRPNDKQRAKNMYETKPFDTQAADRAIPDSNLDPAYTHMRPQVLNSAPPIPPRSAAPKFIPPQNTPNHVIRPVPQIPFQTTQAPNGRHQYVSIVPFLYVNQGHTLVHEPPLPMQHAPTHNTHYPVPDTHPARHEFSLPRRNEYDVEIPHASPPYPGPNPGCHLKHQNNPIHVTEVVYRDSKPLQQQAFREAHVRPRSDCEPLLEVTGNAQNGKRDKKKDKVKKKKKKS